MLNLKGIIKIRMIGAYTDRFVSELIKSNIRVSGVKNINNVIYADVRAADYKKIAALSRKYGVMTRISEKKGIRFRLFKHKRRYGVLIGVIAASCTVLLLQRHIWRIEVHGNSLLSTDYLLSQLESCGVTAGSLTENIDTTDVERRIMLENSGISWLNLEINGSRADLYIRESNIPEKPEISLKTPCNVISSHDAVITETELYSGTLLYKKGDTVGKGTILVSGTVNDGSGNIIYTHADAEIIAEYTEELEFHQELVTLEKIPNGDTETQKQLMMFGFVLPLYFEPVDTENKICTEEIKSLSFMGSELPWKIKTETYTKYEEITVKRTSEDARRLLEGKLELYCFNMYKDQEIQDISKMLEYTENGVTLRAAVKLKGDITELKPIYVKEN